MRKKRKENIAQGYKVEGKSGWKKWEKRKKISVHKKNHVEGKQGCRTMKMRKEEKDYCTETECRKGKLREKRENEKKSVH